MTNQGRELGALFWGETPNHPAVRFKGHALLAPAPAQTLTDFFRLGEDGHLGVNAGVQDRLAQVGGRVSRGRRALPCPALPCPALPCPALLPHARCLEEGLRRGCAWAGQLAAPSLKLVLVLAERARASCACTCAQAVRRASEVAAAGTYLYVPFSTLFEYLEVGGPGRRGRGGCRLVQAWLPPWSFPVVPPVVPPSWPCQHSASKLASSPAPCVAACAPLSSHPASAPPRPAPTPPPPRPSPPPPPQLLHMIAQELAGRGPRVMFYLAAAVADFFLPWSEMVSAPCLLPLLTRPSLLLDCPLCPPGRCGRQRASAA